MMTEISCQTAGDSKTAANGVNHDGGTGGSAPAMTPSPHVRHPWVAILLTQVMPGLGQVYCGQMGKGLVIIFMTSMFALLSLAALAYCATAGTVLLLVAALLPLEVVWLVATVDSFLIARRTRPDYQLRDYNRQYVYVLLVLIGSLSCVAYSFNVRAKFLEPFYLPTTSCYPTFIPGDRVLANKLAYDCGEPQRGDVIVFHRPDNRRAKAIKRIVALPGDTVEIKDGQLYVNGSKCGRQDLGARTVRSGEREVTGRVWQESNGQATYPVFVSAADEGKTKDFPLLKVPEYHCFVLSDDRNFTPDSRQFGPIQVTSIVGRVDYLYWPADSWSRFGRLHH